MNSGTCLETEHLICEAMARRYMRRERCNVCYQGHITFTTWACQGPRSRHGSPMSRGRPPDKHARAFAEEVMEAPFWDEKAVITEDALTCVLRVVGKGIRAKQSMKGVFRISVLAQVLLL